MAEKTKVKEITISVDKSTLPSLFKRISREKGDFDYESLASLRSLLSSEKARMLTTIKSKKPVSIYHLAKLLKRDFKAVSEDIKVLEKFGFIDLIQEKVKNRNRLRPKLIIDTLKIELKL